jgi:hypothetical protein
MLVFVTIRRLTRFWHPLRWEDCSAKLCSPWYRKKRLAGKNGDSATLTAPLQRYAALMVKPPPISLRIRSAEATRNARELLRRLDEMNLLQRRVKLQASKALLALHRMSAFAAQRLQSMPRSGRERWESECQMMEEILKRISRSGV